MPTLYKYFMKRISDGIYLDSRRKQNCETEEYYESMEASKHCKNRYTCTYYQIYSPTRIH